MSKPETGQVNTGKEKIAQVDRPENCTGLTPVDVEDIIWNLLQPQTKNFEKRLQIIQTAMAKFMLLHAAVEHDPETGYGY